MIFKGGGGVLTNEEMMEALQEINKGQEVFFNES